MTTPKAPEAPTLDDFSDEQIVNAAKVAPPQVQMQLSVIAMTMEMRDRRAQDALTLPNQD